MIKIFLATPFAEKARFHEYRNQLLSAGYQVPDWTAHQSIRPYQEHIELAQQYCEENLAEVSSSAYFILIAENPLRGALVELGTALAVARLNGSPKIYVIGSEASMYAYHPLVTRMPSFTATLQEINQREH